jgi:putative ATPase
MGLFEADERERLTRARPLAARMRPRTLEEFVGQRHFLGPGRLLRRLLEADRLGSAIFYGPPGTGKTTLARLLARESHSDFHQVSAVTSNVRELRELLERARARLAAESRRTLLFVDEIHRFNRAQQDVLLGDVEEGVAVLVGATTQNPFFAINSALVSRSRIFEFRPLDVDDVVLLLRRALDDADRGLGQFGVRADEEAIRFLARVSDGDARSALSALEIAILSSTENAGDAPPRLTLDLARESVQRKALVHDRDGDRHYDTASALIKSVRGSDPDAAIYWLACMLEGGEEIRFLTRRLVILASEDIGNADPRALPLAVATMQACEFVGLPECQLNLAQAVLYLACAPKSNAATKAIAEARRDVREEPTRPVPSHLRDRSYRGADRLGHGRGYRSPHDEPDGLVAQEYLGIERDYYHPVDRGFEAALAERLRTLRARVRAERGGEG